MAVKIVVLLIISISNEKCMGHTVWRKSYSGGLLSFITAERLYQRYCNLSLICLRYNNIVLILSVDIFCQTLQFTLQSSQHDADLII